MPDYERSSPTHLNTSTQLYWEWLICIVISERCPMMKHLLQLTSILQHNSGENDWFVLWFQSDVRWWTIFSNSRQYFNTTVLRMIDLYCDFRAMSDDEPSSPTHFNTSTQLCWEWFICNAISARCPMMKHFLQLTSILQHNSPKSDWFLMWFLSDARLWTIFSNSPQYFNTTLVRMIDLYCDFRGMSDDETFSWAHINTAIEL